jgi:hypothetical protein
MNYTELISELIDELSYRVGIPNIYDKEHQRIISEILTEWGKFDEKKIIFEFLTEDDEKRFSNPILNRKIKYTGKDGKEREGLVGNLLTSPKDSPGRIEAEKLLPAPGTPEREKINKEIGSQGGGGEQDSEGDENSAEEEQTKNNIKKTFSTPSQKAQRKKEKEIAKKLNPELAQEEKRKQTFEKTKENREKNQRYLENTKGITSTQNINGIDGPNKENVLNGEEKVPGSPSSAVAEVAVGYGMSCLSENNFDIKKADECLKNKLSETKLGKSYNKPEIRKGALQGAKRELKKVGKLIEDEGLNPKTTTTGHVGGSKDSLTNTVKTLRDKGVTEVNGIPIDEYEKIILEGGGGDNPTDTMVVVIDESTGKSFIYHTSNKMTSADTISNGSPSKEIDEIGNLVEGYDSEQKKSLETAQQKTKDNISKHRKNQVQYIRQQQNKMSEDSNDIEIAKSAISRLKGGEGEENPVSTSGDKYWKKLIGHKSVKSFAKEKGYDLKNLTPEQEIEIYQHYTGYMSTADPELSRAQGGMGDDDVQIITRLYGVFGNPKQNQEELTTKRTPREPVFDEDELNSYYDKQTEELNSLREEMNQIKEGSGDKAFAKRMKKRLHLDIAEGHNPGGIPNDKFETVMGEYNYKDLKQDSDGNLYEKRGKEFVLVNSDGSLGEPASDVELQDLDVSVVGDADTIKRCLGLEEDESVDDGIEIKVDNYDNRKVIIYDRAGKEIGYQTARSKTGPGGSMQDTIAYHKDFQKCLAKQTVLMGK